MSQSITTSWDPVWEEIFSSREWGKYPPEHVVRFVARGFYSAPNRRGVRLLEIGCGPGANVWFMAREGFTVSGIDGSPSAIRQAVDRLAKEGLSADLRVGDTAALPWADDTFDGGLENVALCCNNRQAILTSLQEVRRVLKPGASFQSSFFTDRTWGYGTGKMLEPGGFDGITEGPLVGTGYYLFLDEQGVRDLFADFEDVKVERISWTMEGGKHLVEQFVVICRNP